METWKGGFPKIPSKEVEINVDSVETNNQKDDDNIEEVCVRRQKINDQEYLVSDHNIVFDNLNRICIILKLK